MSSALQQPRRPFVLAVMFAALLSLLLGALPARAHREPANCTGSGLGISLFTSIPDVHIGDTLFYSINVFNGTVGSGRISCDAENITAFIVTPDGVTHPITLVRTTLHQGEADFYLDVVSYVVRAQDIQPDGTLLATARDVGVIHQNDTDSSGGGFQGVNTEVNLPCLLISALCVGGVGENGLITYTGTVTNCGNNTLVGVTVTNFHSGGFFTVLFPTNLARGQSANFSASFLPANPCVPTPFTLTVRASDEFTSTPRLVTNFTSIVCQNTTTPGILVTKVCPAGPVSPGQLLTFSGSVSNTGNITLTNIVVVNNQPAANTTVFTLASLAPGAVANFTGSYTAPTACSVSDTLTATATSRCGVGVSSVASATCPILTTPQIETTVICPVNPIVPGGTLTYSGTVRNTGNITLNNVAVVSDRPAANTSVFTVASLAPGASASFTSSVPVPANACSVTTTFSSTGRDACTSAAVTSTVSTTCTGTTAPAIAVTLACPVVSATTGGLITYSGTVSNPGNVTLNNVFVVNNQPAANTPVIGPITLAPGASANFTTTFSTPANTCLVSSTVTATGNDNCSAVLVSNTASATCALSSTPALVLTQDCPVTAVGPGGTAIYLGTVRNSGNITLTNVNVFTGTFTPPPPATTVPPTTVGLIGYWSFNEASGSVAFDDSGSARNGNIVGATRVAGQSGGGLSFNGSASSVEIPNDAALNISGQITLAAWIRPLSMVGLQNIMAHGYTPSQQRSVFLRINNGQYEVGSQSSAVLERFASAPVPVGDIGNFVHLAGVYDGTAWIIYRNGVALNTFSSAVGAVSVNSTWAIGARPGSTDRFFNGVIDEVRLYNRALDAAEINVLVDPASVPAPPAGPGPSVLVFTIATLAPGASANFNVSQPVPTNSGCSITSTLTANGNSFCTGATVGANVTTTCQIVTAPAIVVTAVCPATPILPGGSFTYSGTVRNTGNITLDNVVVVSDKPTANTTVFTVASLAPGAVASFTSIVTVPANACTITTVFGGTGRDICTLNTVASTVTTTCTITTAPAIAVTLACPVVPASAGGPITYSGTVSNPGNVTLNNVFVVNNQPAANTPVIGPITLAPGASANFTTTFTAPGEACSVSSTVTARGNDNCTAVLVSNTASATCALGTAPSIVVTQACPVSPVSPGGLLTYSGTVRNSGTITLTNVVVVNNLSGASPLIGPITLAPGAVANFTGSYTAPTDCSTTSTSTATGRSTCGVAVSNTASSTCTILTTPQILVTTVCPATPLTPGSTVNYTGTVRNTGNITLSNVAVVSDRPSANTTVFTVASLAPGATANFTGSYTVPANACSVTTTFSGTGRDICTLNTVTSIVSTTCTVITAPAIAVTLACPVVSATAGGPITYSGTVSNPGNVTLNNVFVVNSQLTNNTPVIGPITLAPGASANFTATFTTAGEACSVSSTVTARGNDNCTAALVSNTASATCALITTPAIVVTQVCPVIPVSPGGLLTYTGTVRNSGNITLTNVVVLNNLSGATPVFTALTMSPGAVSNFTGSYVASTDCTTTSTSTATARSICGVAVSNTASATCTILTTPAIVVTAVCPPTPILPGGSFTYSGTVRNAGNITLNNVVVVSDRPSANTTVFTVASLAPGASASFTSSVTVPVNACTVTTAFSGTGRDICTLNTVTNTVSTTCTVTTAPAIAVTLACPVVPATAGGLITYSGTVSNPGNVTLNNVFVVNSQLTNNTPVIGPITLAPGASANFTTTFTTAADTCSVSSTVTASGNDNCTAALVSNTASATCTLVTTPAIVVTQVCPVIPPVPGALLTYSGTVRNSGNVTLTNVVVVNNLSGASPLIGPITLAPGAIASFTGSYVAPTDCSSSSTSTATGRSICGVAVSNSAGSTCPIQTTPAIVVTQICPLIPVMPGGVLTYTGTVRNAGNITLTNIIVVNNLPATNTVIFTLASLAPGASASFTGSYLTPDDCCIISSTIRGSGQGCLGVTVTDTATRTCTLQTLPALVVTKVCPTGVLRPGDLLTYSGTVSNAGSITLINVIVVNNQPSNTTPVLGPLTLAPGETFNYTASYIVPPDFCGTDTVTVSGMDICTFLTVTSSVTTTCPITTTPRITVTKNCPLLPVPLGGLFTYTGSVSNAGNVTLVNVFVVDNQPAINTPVIGPITLAPGAFANFSRSYFAPTDCCEIIDTVTARGQDRCTGSNVTATATAFCLLVSAPAIAVVQNCPPAPIPMGSVFAFSGFVTNTGNVVLTNVFVFGPQGTNTVLVGPIELAPGETEFYSGSFTVPFNTCSVSITATGLSVCGSNNVVVGTGSCPVATTPAISIVKLCPPVPVAPGGLLVFSAAIANTGNITLTNIFVVNNQPTNNTPVLGPITLAPGASTNFTGSYVVPLNACSSSDTLTVIAGACGSTITNSATANCPFVTTPGIIVTQNCPPGQISAGSTVAYGGTVSNSGNITLTNVFVFSQQPTNNTMVLGPITLAPGATAPYSGSYIATGGANPTNNLTVVTNSNAVITTNSTPVVTTNTTVTVSTNTVTPTFGTIDPVVGTLTDRFSVTNGLHGLMFSDQDQQWGPTLFYSTRNPATGSNQFVSISTVTTVTNSFGAVTDRFPLSSTNYDALTLAAPDVGYGSVNLYYFRHDSPSVSTFGVIKPAGASSSSDLPVSPLANSGYNALAFAEANVGDGANMFYYLRTDNTGLSTFGTLNPTPGLTVTDLYGVGTNFDGLVFVPGAVSTWGSAIFAYLRHDATGSIIGSINPVTQVVTDRLSLGTNLLTSLTFTASDVGFGPNLFYYLRPEQTILTTNTVITFTTNTVITFTTNTVITFTTNSLITFTATNIVTATGIDICQARTVGSAANCNNGPGIIGLQSVPPPPPSSPTLASPTMANGFVNLSFPTENGVWYTIQYKNALGDPAWTDLQTIVGTGGSLPISDPTASQQPTRFYRVIATP